MRYFKIFAFSVLFLIKCNFLLAQKDLTDSVRTYEYWAERGIIEVVNAYMNDYIITVTDTSLPKEKIKDCTKEKAGLREYEKQFVAPLANLGIEELSSKLNEVSTFLISNNWPGAEKNLIQPLIGNFKTQKALTNDFFNTLKPSINEKSTSIPGYSNKLVNWNNAVERIITAYNNDLKKILSVKDSGSVPKVITNTNKTSGIITENKPPVPTPQNWLIIGLSSLLLFLFGMFLCYYFIKSRIYFFLDDDVKTYKNSISRSGLFSFLSIIQLLKQRKDDYKDKVTELERTIKDLEKKALQENVSTGKVISNSVNTEKTNGSTENTVKSVEWDLSKGGSNKSLLYFSIPENDGRFIFDKGEQTNDGSKYYKVEYSNSSDEGNLFYISGTQDKRAINRLDSYLKPVCDIDNISNAESATKIELLKHGKVIKKADSWVIDTNLKVKIKLV
jgi:hypothetical protein